MRLFKRHLGWSVAGFAVVAIALFFGCAKEPLTPLQAISLAFGEKGSATLNFCTDAPQPLPFENDYIIVIDNSTVNALNCQTTNFICNLPVVVEPGTNPNGDLSFGVIASFLDAIQAQDPNDPNNYFELITYDTNPTVTAALGNNL